MRPRLSKTAARQVLAMLREIAEQVRREAVPGTGTDQLLRNAWCDMVGRVGAQAEMVGLNSDLLPNIAFPAKERRSA